MNRTFVFSILMIIICSQMPFVHPDQHRQRRDEAGRIQLKDFGRPIVINQQNIYGDCGRGEWCDTILQKAKRTGETHEYKGLDPMKCNGYLEDCYYFDGMRGTSSQGQFCTSENHLKWAKEDSNMRTLEYGLSDSCRPQNNSPPRKMGNSHCHTCICRCIEVTKDSFQKGNWAFSLQPSLSDVADQKVVVGVRIQTNKNRLIYLEIEEKQLGSEKPSTWKSLEVSETLVKNVDNSLIVPENKAVLLGEIFVPSDHVITGVRFSKASTNLEGQKSAIRLEVQGTKVNVESNELVGGTSFWFNYNNSSPPPLKRLNTTLVPKSKSITVFRNVSDIHRDLDRLTIPYLDTSDVVVDGVAPLKGIALVCKQCDTDQEYLALRVDALIAPKTEVPPTIATEKGVSTTVAPETEVSTTNATETEVSTTNATETEVSTTNATEKGVSTTIAPETEVSTTNATETEVSTTIAPETEVSTTIAPETEVSTTIAPETEVSTTNATEKGVSTTNATEKRVFLLVVPKQKKPSQIAPKQNSTDIAVGLTTSMSLVYAIVLFTFATFYYRF